jgi:hypothetical protein
VVVELFHEDGGTEMDKHDEANSYFDFRNFPNTPKKLFPQKILCIRYTRPAAIPVELDKIKGYGLHSVQLSA